MSISVFEEIDHHFKNGINDHIHNILSLVDENPVTNVISSSGTGKTTILPLKIQEAGNNIMVVVSNEDIVESLSKYNSKITYISSNNMKEKLYSLIKNKTNDFISSLNILIIDEADSSSLNMTMILLLWRYAAENKFRVPKLLLVSNTEINNELFDIKHYHIQTNNVPEIRYLKWGRSSSLESLIYDTYNEVNGDILVFLTSDEIDKISLYGINSYTDKDISEIYTDKSKKVILSEKLAETSITLSNLTVIIDTLQNIKPRLTLTGGIRYKKGYITKQQANLRASRGAKLVYRLMSPDKYDNLSNYELPEIYSKPLYHTMLEILEHGIDPFNILTMFKYEEIQYNYNLLIRMGVINSLGKITQIGKFIKRIPLGIRNAVGLYKWLETGQPVYPGVVLLTMIDSFDSYFIYPLKKEQSHTEYMMELLNHRKKYFNPLEGKSDIHTYSNIWNIMLDEIDLSSDLSSISFEKSIDEWSKNNFINSEILLEVNTVVNGILKILQEVIKEERNYDIGSFDTDNTVSLIGPIIADIYSDRMFKIFDNKSVRIRYFDPLNQYGKFYKIDSQQSINNIERNVPEIVYGLITSTISSNYSSDFHLISCSLVLD